MELPKNITQIGETNPHCKVYVEDYVISYIKQLNQYAGEKEMAVALYGIRKEEAGITYLFLYGACRLVFLQKECRHLSSAVQQEAEKQRRKFFPDSVFLGYRLLDGEMVEGFHICEQGVCRYVEGYAQFYEKNDAMLAFMLEERQEAAKPESVDQEKYNVVKKRQEERRARAEEKGGHAILTGHKAAGKPTSGPGLENGRLRGMKLTAAAVFGLLCVTGLAAMENGEKLKEWQTAVRQLVEDMSEQQLPDSVPVSNGSAQVGTIVAEDKLTDAILHENAAADPTLTGQDAAPGSPSGQNPEAPTQGGDQPSTPGSGQDQQPAPGEGQPSTPDSGQDQQPAPGEGQPSMPGSGQDQQPAPGESQPSTPDSGQDQQPAPGEGQPLTPGSGQGQVSGTESDQQSDTTDDQKSADEMTQSGQESGETSSDQASGGQSSQASTGQSAAQESGQTPESKPASGSSAELISYTVQRGDTLIGICVKRYGSDTRVSEICSLNNIENPDDIKVGEKIFLPQ